MHHRCLKDRLGYCIKEPEYDETPTGVDIKHEGKTYGVFLMGGSCRLDPRTCGNFLTNAQLSEDIHARRNTSQKHKAVGKSKAGKRH